MSCICGLPSGSEAKSAQENSNFGQSMTSGPEFERVREALNILSSFIIGQETLRTRTPIIIQFIDDASALGYDGGQENNELRVP